jgi:hypothetical protein
VKSNIYHEGETKCEEEYPEIYSFTMTPAIDDSYVNLEETDLNNPTLYKVHPGMFGQYVLSEIFPFAEKAGANNEEIFQTQVVGNYLKHIAQVKKQKEEELDKLDFEDDALSCASSDIESEDLEVIYPLAGKSNYENFFSTDNFFKPDIWKIEESKKSSPI